MNLWGHRFSLNTNQKLQGFLPYQPNKDHSQKTTYTHQKFWFAFWEKRWPHVIHSEFNWPLHVAQIKWEDKIALNSLTGLKYFYECIFAEKFHAFQANSLLVQCLISVASFLIAKHQVEQGLRKVWKSRGWVKGGFQFVDFITTELKNHMILFLSLVEITAFRLERNSYKGLLFYK